MKFDFLGLKTPHRHRQGGGAAQEARHRSRHPEHRFQRSGHLRDAVEGRQRRRVPARRRRHARSLAQDEARPGPRPHRARGALPPGSDGLDPEIHRGQERQGGAGLSPSAARADPERDLRRHDVSGRRHEHRARAGRLFARPGPISCAAPWARRSPPKWRCTEERFIKGAVEKGIPKGIAEQIFEQAAKFAGYGFNKGHAAAYAQVAYQTAYLKANYPVEFLAASMTLDIGNTDRLNVFKQEAQRLEIKVLPPGRQPLRIRLHLRRREGAHLLRARRRESVGRQAMDHVVRSARQTAVPQPRRFRPPHRSKLVNKRAFESLARAGAFDALNRNRPPGRRIRRHPPEQRPAQRPRARIRPRSHCLAVRRRTTSAWSRSPTGRRMSGWAKNSPPWASISRATRSTPMPRR